MSNGDYLVLLFVSRDRRGDGIIQASEEKKDEEEHSPTGNREKRFLITVNLQSVDFVYQLNPGFGNLSKKNRLRDSLFSSKSRQVSRQGFLRGLFKTGKQNIVLKRETGIQTGFQAGQGLPPHTVLPRKNCYRSCSVS